MPLAVHYHNIAQPDQYTALNIQISKDNMNPTLATAQTTSIDSTCSVRETGLICCLLCSVHSSHSTSASLLDSRGFPCCRLIEIIVDIYIAVSEICFQKRKSMCSTIVPLCLWRQIQNTVVLVIVKT